jgi:ketol-acid reductoisomerase
MGLRQSRWLDASEASLESLRGLGIVVVGYGNQGRAQALNLRDSGAGSSVSVWARPAGASAARARAEGFEVLATEDLARGDLFLCLLPDETHLEFVCDVLTPALVAAKKSARIGFAHGFSLEFSEVGRVVRREPWREAFLVAPSGPGTEVRSAFASGWGVPAFVAVWHDATGQARARALAVAHAIGATRPGVLETTVREEAIVDLFGEQAVICGGIAALLSAAFQTLTQAGYSPEMAYVECVHQVRLTADLIHRFGLAGMRERISRTALYGDLTRGPKVLGGEDASAMAEILSEIESGSFSKEWLAEYRRGLPFLKHWRQGLGRDEMERVGREVRRRVLPRDADEAGS